MWFLHRLARQTYQVLATNYLTPSDDTGLEPTNIFPSPNHIHLSKALLSLTITLSLRVFSRPFSIIIMAAPDSKTMRPHSLDHATRLAIDTSAAVYDESRDEPPSPPPQPPPSPAGWNRLFRVLCVAIDAYYANADPTPSSTPLHHQASEVWGT